MRYKIILGSLLLGSILGGLIFFSFHYFPQAFPLVSVSITMNREQALEKAQQLAQKYNWQPHENVTQAAYFHLDSEVRNYIELEAGGNKAFKKFLTEHIYEPYTWIVRRCQENAVEQTYVVFKPTGEFYSFSYSLAETTPGARLESNQARAIAEENAQHFGINLHEYKLVETSQQEAISKRIDHTFVYELQDHKINEATYRLTLIVSGDQLTEIKQWMFIPESFKRRYTELRALNNILFRIATTAMWLLYILGCCLIGIIILARKHFLLIRPAVIAGFTLGFLHAAVALNNLPLTLFNYDTASNFYIFALQKLTEILYETLYYGVLYIISILAAEGLTRIAFGNHIQLWKLWSFSTLSSMRASFQIIVGYLAVPLFTAYVISFYAFGSPLFHWWTPSDMLVDPNILATFIPWLSPLAESTIAGFWEECLFRAVPLASGALIGTRFGFRSLGIAIAFIVQIVVFGAAHANYPGLPFYIRLVELLFSSALFGFLYLRFGLITGIISHILYDIVWFSLPIFVSTAPGSLLSKVIILAASSSLLVFALWYYFTHRSSKQPPTNADWHPSKKAASDTKLHRLMPAILSKHAALSALFIGALSAVVWLFATQWHQDAPALSITRNQAIVLAHNEMKKRSIDLEEWTSRSIMQATVTQQDRYVWQKAGKEVYEQLQNSYLMPPAWLIRFIKTTGPVAERAEEYHVWLDDRGVLRFEHIVPEHRPGASLTEEQARILAQKALSKQGIDYEKLYQITARSDKKPERLDWFFEFEDPAVAKLNEDLKARIIVKIAGDEIIDMQKTIFVPEEFQRHERNLLTLYGIIQVLISLAFAVLIMAGMWMLYQKTAYRILIDRRHMLALVGLWLGFIIINFTNMLPLITAYFNTTEPQTTQLVTFIFSLLIKNIMRGLALFVIFSIVYHTALRFKLFEFIAASSLAMLFLAVQSLTTTLLPKISPLWATATDAATYFPLLGLSLQSYMLDFIFTCMIGYILLLILDVAERTRLALISPFVFVILALLYTPLTINNDLITWLIKVIIYATIFAASYYFVVRHRSASQIWFTVILFTGKIIQDLMMNSWHGAAPNSLLALVIMYAVALYLNRHCAIETSNSK